jgi:putative ABC transport system ATP-binding protein
MIKITNLSVEFITPIENKVVLKNVNLNLEINNLVIVAGGSGSGKSTLLDVLTLNNLSFTGSYYYKNNNVKTSNINIIKRKIVYLNQGQALFGKFDSLENTKLINSKISHNIFDAVMAKFNLGKIKSKIIELLSGGEKQRVGIVRSLSKKCELLVLDEPTSNLDYDNRAHFIEEINKYKAGKLIIIATHDDDLIKQADILISLDNGSLSSTKKSRSKDDLYTTKTSLSRNNVINLIFKDLLTNKKRLLLFISAMSNGLLGLLMGFVIVSGFEGMFISILVDQVASELSVAYPTLKKDRMELGHKFVYLSDNPIVISSDILNFIDSTTDLINTAQIDNQLINNQIVLLLDDKDYEKYRLNTLATNRGELNLKYKDKKLALQLKNVIKSDNKSLRVSKDFIDIVVNGLELEGIYKKTKVLNLTLDNLDDNVLISKIASMYQLNKLGNYITEVETGNYFNKFDLDNFSDYLICNQDYKIYCDLNSASAYIELQINEKNYFAKVNDGPKLSLSSEIYKNLNSPNVEVLFDDSLIVNSLEYTLFESTEIELTLPYNIISEHLINYYGPMVQSQYLLLNKEDQTSNTISNYKIISPYESYLDSFKEILDAVFIVFLVYSLISLLLGIVTVSILIILELETRKKHIGTLMLLGWSSNEIRIWVISNSIIKTILTFIITSVMIQISINTLNVVIKEVSTILIVFNYPPLNIMLILIISLLLIISNISLFHVNYLLKNTPKKLISEI